MTFINAIKTCVIEKYCCFKGRARRSEYWYFFLATTILSWILSFFGMGSIMAAANQYMIDNDFAAYFTAILTAPGMIISTVVSLALLLPNLGVTVRRFHDIGKSGWYVLVMYVVFCIPLINFIAILYYLYLLIKDSEPGENEYGPNPKDLESDNSNF